MDTQEKIIASIRNWLGEDSADSDESSLTVGEVRAYLDRLAALPKAEPVAWLCDGPHGRTAHVSRIKILPEAGCTWSPLYTHPAPQPAPTITPELREAVIRADEESQIEGGNFFVMMKDDWKTIRAFLLEQGVE